MSVTLKEELEDLETAEEFLAYFDIDFDPHVVQVNRLHIMQKFHNYLQEQEEQVSRVNDSEQQLIFKSLLQKAYQDFVESDALTEKVFKVFHRNEPQTTFVSIDELMGP